MADKTPVMIHSVKVVKLFNPKLKAKVQKAVEDSLGKALKSGKLEVVSSVGSGAKGFGITPSVEAIDFDEAAKTLSGKFSCAVTVEPKGEMFAFPKGAAKVDGVNTKKIDGDVEALIDAVMSDLGGKAAKAMEKKIKDL